MKDKTIESKIIILQHYMMKSYDVILMQKTVKEEASKNKDKYT